MMKRILMPVLLLLLVALVWLKPLDDLAATQAEAGLQRAVTSFATARLLNGVISVLQGTEVSAGVVVGVTLAPGQVLDPVNDLIEQFSTLMLAASIAFGAQLLLMKMGASWAMALLLTLVIIVWIGLSARERTAPTWLTRLLLALLLVRFIVPVAALSSELAYQAFMAQDYVTSQQGIEQSAHALGTLNVADSGTQWWAVRERIDKLKLAAERLVDYLIRIAVVFLLQTLVLPLLVFWLLLHGSRLLVLGAVPSV